MTANYREKEASAYLAAKRISDEVAAFRRFKRLCVVFLFVLCVGICTIIFSNY